MRQALKWDTDYALPLNTFFCNDRRVSQNLIQLVRSSPLVRYTRKNDPAGIMSWSYYEGWYAERDWRDTGQTLGLVAFLPEVSEGEVNAFNLTEPHLVFGAGSAAQEVLFDLVQPGQNFGLMASMGQRKQEFSCWHDEPYGRAQPPISTFRRSKFLCTCQADQA